MATINRPTISPNQAGGNVTYQAEGGFSRTVPGSMWEQVVADYNKTADVGADIRRHQGILNNPNDPYWTTEMVGSGGPLSQAQRRSDLQSIIANKQALGSVNPVISNPYNLSGVPENITSMLASNLASKTYGGFADQANASMDQEVMRKHASQGPGGFASFVRGAVPLAIGGGLAALGGAALAPGLFAGGAAGTTGISAGGATAGVGGGTGGGFLGSIGSTLTSPAAISGAVRGGIGGLISGGDFSSALKGAGLGAFGGGYGSAIGGSLGLGGFGQKIFTDSLTGAAGGLGSGNLRDAGLGAILGGGSSYLSSGGNIPGLGNFEQTMAPGQFGPPKPGTGILGKLGGLGNLGSLTGAEGGAQPMKLGSLLQAGGRLYSYGQGKDDIEDMQRMLETQAGRAEGLYQPYAQAGQQALSNLQAPSMEALENDPGYQFRLQQGQQALDRSLAARGMSQSGAALKAAQEYGQGLAGQTYDNFFNRQSQIANLGYGSAGGLGNIYAGLGDAQAAAQRAQIENRNRLFGGLGGIFG